MENYISSHAKRVKTYIRVKKKKMYHLPERRWKYPRISHAALKNKQYDISWKYIIIMVILVL